jgi:hypothetical protein
MRLRFGGSVDVVGGLGVGGEGGGGNEAEQSERGGGDALAREYGHDRPPRYVLLE